MVMDANGKSEGQSKREKARAMNSEEKTEFMGQVCASISRLLCEEIDKGVLTLGDVIGILESTKLGFHDAYRPTRNSGVSSMLSDLLSAIGDGESH